ncbi:MmgE/PrpD family protein [Prevotella sp. E2-28]|uniref:MmgE/PrpD family protein n=1 Tax=Prevotella sp. E2-28 TaxID=2913620 RepID=UPI001EDA262C|nr:MmgE/PrpD family protein [Prevotella sp. E2-28]UKK54771.1 MmgE/PrpD family protein [Prevotella sp. E2-28]
MNITDQFVHNVIDFSKRPFSEEVFHHARKCYLDYLGCVLGGSKQNDGKLSKLLSSGLLEKGDCTVFGTDVKLAFRDAGFVNGFNAHAMEMDDGHRYAMLHIEAPLFSAMTALYEKEQLSTDAFYKGIIVGYEVTVRVSRSLQPWHKVRGYHSTGTCATIGVAMATAMALDFDFDQTKAALTAAASSSAGLLELLHDDSEMKPYNVGRAVMDGLTAAYFGSVGYIPPVDVLGGKRGFLNIMSDTQHPEFLTIFDEKDKPSILGNFFKPYPACRHCHSTIDAALQIARDNDIAVSDIEKIKIGVYKLALMGHNHTEVNSSKSAMMSIPYGAVVSLAKKDAGLSQYKEDVVISNEIQKLLTKVEISEDEELTSLSPDIRGSKVEVQTAGRTYRKRVDYSLGEPENPMSDQDIIEKFQGLAAYAEVDNDIASTIVNKVFNGEVLVKI